MVQKQTDSINIRKAVSKCRDSQRSKKERNGVLPVRSSRNQSRMTCPAVPFQGIKLLLTCSDSRYTINIFPVQKLQPSDTQDSVSLLRRGIRLCW